MSFHYRYRKQILIIVLVILVVTSIVTFSVIKLGSSKKNSKDKKNVSLLLENKKQEKKFTEKKEEEVFKVDIKGEVQVPGIYSLEESSRVIDVIDKAGGLTENADTSVINLSLKIHDEMVIIIYNREQVQDFKKTKEIEKQVEDKCRKPDNSTLTNDACISNDNNKSNNKSSTAVEGKISINTASVEELMNLPGIGEAKAKEIIAYRDTNGLFENIEDITKVPGIGENIFAQIKENITV